MVVVFNKTRIDVMEEMMDKLNLHLSLIVLVFGTVGNILNCLVLSRPSLRTNPCAQYFLSSSVVNMISLIFGLSTRLLSSWHVDPTDTNDYLCKLRAFVVFTFRTIGIWLIMFATIDRWFLSSRKHNLRSLSNLKTVHLGIVVCCCISISSYIHMFFCYQANLVHTPLKCYGKTISCRLTTDLVYALITILIPSILMISFSLLIIKNIHHLHIRKQHLAAVSVERLSRPRETKIRRIDYNLLRMLLIQVFLLVSFCLPQAIQKFYITFKATDAHHDWRDIVSRFLYNVDVLLAFVASGMPFYLYTFTSRTVVRREFFALVGILIRRVAGESIRSFS
ncbi:unnamed protein product [Adineta ricciae]|uniref:G-protein coupled receptors family 1 profile domain-containing protein n=1 Tax=Adineta ricciae TaxID=249248 RepID=A0A813R0W8_ADIRI|nr:unnamed protein product [Adineta ricciae]